MSRQSKYTESDTFSLKERVKIAKGLIPQPMLDRSYKVMYEYEIRRPLTGKELNKLREVWSMDAVDEEMTVVIEKMAKRLKEGAK
jgi:hypothetical protein